MLRVSNRKNFTKHVKDPAIVVLLLIGFYIGGFANVYLYGQPITLFVASMPIIIAGAIFSTIKKEDI